MEGLGPVLYFRGVQDGLWNLSALVTTAKDDAPAPLVARTGRVAPRRLARRCGQSLWRFDFSLPLDGDVANREYAIGDESWRVHVPTPASPLRLAFTACNGDENGDAGGSLPERNERWMHLAAEHGRRPFHLLLQGGDQIYADPVWREVPALAEWRALPWRKRRRAAFSPEAAEAVRDFYFDQYCRLWCQPQLAPILSQIPSLMMWDDHDIFDGWGSYPAEWHDCAVFQGVWSAAREHFALFQLAARPDDLPAGFDDRSGGQFGWAYRIGHIGILAPDLRSQRTRRRVMGEGGRQAFIAALESMAECRHVLIVSTVPLVNAQLTPLERLFAWVPGHQSLQDDLIDQWPSAAHWEEWSALLRELAGFSARTGTKLTSLSGEIHMGALGVVESRGARIHQLTSSGVVHPPPPPAVVTAFEWASERAIQVAPEIEARLLPLPDLGRRYLRARNWLEIELPAGGGLLAAWHAEGRSAPIRLSIPAAGRCDATGDLQPRGART